MKMIHAIKEKGGVINSFISHCGGLIAPESDNNPWHYKITWNPRNIVLAGKDGAEYLKENKTVNVPYKSVFRNCPAVNLIENYPLCWYPNRDSLHYIDLYGLQGISTFIRTTLRHPAFCRGWNKFVNMRLTATDDLESIKDCKTYADWLTVKTAPYFTNKDWTNYLQIYLTDPFKHEFDRQMIFLGLRSNNPLPQNFKCSADILQYLLEEKLAIHPDDKDMIVMLHELEYTVGGQQSKVHSSLIVKGEDNLKTAMAKTVGLPLGIATKLMLQDKIKITGLHIPIVPGIYEPVLAELEANGIKFNES
jgi:saccharopine dehydrogenase (NADP+, L-glutamate forming)